MAVDLHNIFLLYRSFSYIMSILKMGGIRVVNDNLKGVNLDIAVIQEILSAVYIWTLALFEPVFTEPPSSS